MRTILIVDDEPLVQVGLQTMVDWGAWGARVLPPASNGEVALQAIVEHHPDVVFTDIRMPLMDGLELIRRCRAEVSPCPEFVVLTSFADFAYAREAVKYEVVDYLIKLEITPGVLSQAFAKACRRLDAGQRPARAEPEPSPLDRLTDVVQREFGSETEAVAHLGAGVVPEGDWFSVAVFQRSEGDPDQEPYARRLLREVLSREFRVYDFHPGVGRFGFVLAGESAAGARVHASVAQALEMGRRYFNGVVLGGLGPLVPSLTGLASSHRGALEALEGAHVRGPLVAGSDQGTGLTGEQLRSELERALETQDTDAVGRVFERARAQIAQGRLADALELATAAQYGVLAALPGAEDLLSRWFGGGGAKVLYAIPTPEHVVSWMNTLEGGLVDHLQNLRSRPQEALVEAMRLHAQTHHRERVSLKEVAALFRLSPNYAGALFRRHTGKGYAEYVCEVKVSKARELLETGKYRVYEVSDLLGFENAYSFSKVFRRVTGKSPRRFLPQALDS